MPNPSELERQAGPVGLDADLQVIADLYGITYLNSAKPTAETGTLNDVAFLLAEAAAARRRLRDHLKQQFRSYCEEVAEHGKDSGVSYSGDGGFIEVWWSQEQSYVERVKGTNMIELCRSMDSKEIVGVRIHGVSLTVSMSEIKQE